jgi:hypothetical protein
VKEPAVAEEEKQVKIIAPLDSDTTTPIVVNTTYTDTSVLAMIVNNVCAPGDPYYVFDSLAFNDANGVATDWVDSYPAGSLGSNRTAIEAMLASPPTTRVWAA